MALFAWLGGIVASPIRGIIKKDFMVLRRDLRNLSQLVTPIIFGVIYASMFLSRGGELPAGRSEAPTWFMTTFRSLLSYGNIGVALFVGWSLLTRLGGMAFSQEGKNYWILKASPVRVADLLVAKFLVAYLPALALGSFFLTAISLLQGVPPLGYLYSLLITVVCLAGMSGILVGFGAAGANLTWDDPRKMNAGSLGCLGTFLTALFVPVSVGFFLGPLALTALFQLPEFYGYLSGIVFGVSVSAVCGFLPLWFAREKVEQLGEA